MAISVIALRATESIPGHELRREVSGMLEHAVKACTVGIAEQQFGLPEPSVANTWSSKFGRRAAERCFRIRSHPAIYSYRVAGRTRVELNRQTLQPRSTSSGREWNGRCGVSNGIMQMFIHDGCQRQPSRRCRCMPRVKRCSINREQSRTTAASIPIRRERSPSRRIDR